MTATVGIDISGVQADQVPGDWLFVVVKSTEGDSVVNPRVAAQWQFASQYPSRGLYHYARPAISNGTTQANIFAHDALVRGFKPGTDMWQLDCEEGENAGVGNWRDFIDQFMTTAIALLGKRGFLYAGEPFLQAHGLTDLPYKYMWWLPDYGPDSSPVDNGLTHLGATAGLVVIHQFTSAGGLDRNNVHNALAYGARSVPAPIVVDKVKFMYDPPINNIRASCACPTGGAWLVGEDGSVYAVGGAPFWSGMGMNDNPNFVNRKAAQITAFRWGFLNRKLGITITDTVGETYTKRQP